PHIVHTLTYGPDRPVHFGPSAGDRACPARAFLLQPRPLLAGVQPPRPRPGRRPPRQRAAPPAGTGEVPRHLLLQPRRVLPEAGEPPPRARPRAGRARAHHAGRAHDPPDAGRDPPHRPRDAAPAGR